MRPGEPGFEEHKRAVLDTLHRVEHQHGRCPCNRPLPEPTPEELDTRARARGLQATATARAAGVDLGQPTPEELVTLGHSAQAADLAELIARMQAANRAERGKVEGGARPWQPDDPVPADFDETHGDPTRAAELELVRRHNDGLLAGDPRWRDLYLDQLFAQGQPILHLDPERADRGEELQTAPERDVPPSPEISAGDASVGRGQGEAGTGTRASSAVHDRNKEKDPIKEMVEYEPPDDEWS